MISGLKLASWEIDSGKRKLSGWTTSRPYFKADSFTGDAITGLPLPAGLSGWVYTAATS
jgi:hypothetical protein